MKDRGISKFKQGHVISDKMSKTVVVEVMRKVQHPIFKKYYSKSSKFYAHDEAGTARKGDFVRIKEIGPVSALKRWKVIEVLKKGMVEEAGSVA